MAVNAICQLIFVNELGFSFPPLLIQGGFTESKALFSGNALTTFTQLHIYTWMRLSPGAVRAQGLAQRHLVMRVEQGTAFHFPCPDNLKS